MTGFFKQFKRAPTRFRANLDSSDWAYLREEQRRQAGCSAGRMQQDLRDETLASSLGRRNVAQPRVDRREDIGGHVAADGEIVSGA
jgi:hypothetical protein